MISTICIFEDPRYTNLLPLTYTRPVYDLRCGVLTLREKLAHAYPDANLTLLCRPYLAEVVKQQNPGIGVEKLHVSSALLINGRVLADKHLRKTIPLDGEDAVYLSGDTVVAVRISTTTRPSAARDLSEAMDPEHFGELPRIQVDVPLIEYPWHLVNRNADEIARDFRQLLGRKKALHRGKVYPGAHLVNRNNIFVGEGAVLKPGVVLDATDGPIYIGEKALIMPNAVIEGPAFVGEGSIIKAGAKIYAGTSIGERCKVGGEVEASIIHAYANKQHDGFLGHSYIGMWCNLGADTNTSDLKNNYSSIRVFINEREVDTGSMFVGLFMGDHSKSGINTMFNSGTVVGVSSNIFGAGFPPKYIPSFAWGGADGLDTYDLEKSLEVARRVMARRDVPMTPADERLLRKIFELTMSERRRMRREQETILIPPPFPSKQ